MTENKNINSIVSALVEGHHRMDIDVINEEGNNPYDK